MAPVLESGSMLMLSRKLLVAAFTLGLLSMKFSVSVSVSMVVSASVFVPHVVLRSVAESSISIVSMIFSITWLLFSLTVSWLFVDCVKSSLFSGGSVLGPFVGVKSNMLRMGLGGVDRVMGPRCLVVGDLLVLCQVLDWLLVQQGSSYIHS